MLLVLPDKPSTNDPITESETDWWKMLLAIIGSLIFLAIVAAILYWVSLSESCVRSGT